MPRTIDVSAPPERVPVILKRVRQLDGVIGLLHQRGASLQPSGDLVTIHTTNDGARHVIELLDQLDVLADGSITTSEPRSVISPEHQPRINRESNESIWDEMAFLLREDTNLAPNFLSLMFLAGAVAGVGLWADTLHIVIGAMVIAPAFEPLVRLSFGGIIGAGRIALMGLASTVAGYLVLGLGGIVTFLLLRAIDPSGSVELESRTWVRYWSTMTPPGVVASVLAAAAGAVVISGQRSVLTTGVMIALALVPSMSLVGMALAAGNTSLAGQALVRWGVDVVLVVGVGALVLVVKRMYLKSHPALT